MPHVSAPEVALRAVKTRAETKTTMTTVSKGKLSPTVDPGFCGEQWQEKTPERGGDPDMSMSCCVCMETAQSLSSLSSISAAQQIVLELVIWYAIPSREPYLAHVHSESWFPRMQRNVELSQRFG